MQAFESKKQVIEMLRDSVRFLYRREPETASKEQIYFALSRVIRDRLMDVWIDIHDRTERADAKKLYYLSMEFLIGRTLSSNIMNLDEGGMIKEALSEMGVSLNEIEDEERDPALGNGGLGRLAACFMDSLATLGYPAYGCGIRYRYGLFRQKIIDGCQVEMPDNWLKDGYPFEVRRSEYTCEVRFGGEVATLWDGKRNYFELHNYQVVKAIPYDIPVIGYGGKYITTLRVWDAEPVEEFNLNEFDQGHYLKAVEEENLAEALCSVLYPNDNHIEGKTLRFNQQYFFVSATLQTAVNKFREKHDDMSRLPDYAVFHMNDTHPTLAVAELMRILLDDYHLEWDEAWKISGKCCCFTNHTILPEALETWPESLVRERVPRVYQIIQEMDRRLRLEIDAKLTEPELYRDDMTIIQDGRIRMANLAIYASRSVNGVAQIHSWILKEYTFAGFNQLMPQKFGNKTNGITQRRFLLEANPLLSQWISKRIGTGWITDLSQMKKLEAFAHDEECLKAILSIRRENKLRLGEYIRIHNGIEVDPDSIFDIQVKRLHEYKRQLLNILHVMYLYTQLKWDPESDIVPRTVIFGAKAAPGYRMAKQIIRLINDVANTVNSDETIQGKLKVVFIEDYCVSNAELIFPAADLSEQISTASKEASGTSNMKFMANGAITIGTMDGANIEIVTEAGEENEIIFGLTAQEVLDKELREDYCPEKILSEDPELSVLLTQLVNGTYCPDDPERYREIYRSLTEGTDGKPADPYFVLTDFRDYVRAKNDSDKLYRDRMQWARMSLMNMANCGKFSSDRTIEEYVNDYWHLKKMI